MFGVFPRKDEVLMVAKTVGKSRAYYSEKIEQFLVALDDEVLGHMAGQTEYPIDLSQRDAWIEQFRIMREALKDVVGHLFLEFVVPRIGSRVIS